MLVDQRIKTKWNNMKSNRLRDVVNKNRWRRREKGRVLGYSKAKKRERRERDTRQREKRQRHEKKNENKYREN